MYVHNSGKAVIKYIENEQLLPNTYDFDLCSFGTQLKNGGERTCKECLMNGVCQGGYIGTFPD